MIIEAKQVQMTYPTGKRALDDVSFRVESPALLGLVGPNGAGKTTMMKLLVGALLQTRGSILVDGKPLREVEKAMKAKLGYLPQIFGLYDELSVWQFLDYMAALKGIRDSRREIARVIEETHLGEQQRARIRTLSGGQRQRVGIAQALLGNPEFLIFDEPTVGLDPEERISFRNLFSSVARDKIVLLSTHIIEDVQSICGRLIAMNHGRILYDGSPTTLIAQTEGHVGIVTGENVALPEGVAITSRVNTATGIACRIVGTNLPSFAMPVEPTLEDAYMYLLESSGEKAKEEKVV